MVETVVETKVCIRNFYINSDGEIIPTGKWHELESTRVESTDGT